MAKHAKDNRADSARGAFQRYLKQRGIKLTSPRSRILDVVLEMTDHFEAEQLLFALRMRGERAAKATIYRTLPLLVDCGILKQVRFDVKHAHYELCYGENPHDHMVCRRCGRIVEFDSQDVIALRTRLARKHRFHALSHRLQVSGLCWECANRCPAVMSMAAPPPRS